MTPRAFSFNSPHGACPECQGLGASWDFDPARLVPDPSKSLADGAIAPWARGDRKLVRDALDALSRALRHRLSTCRSRSCRASTATCCCSGRPRGGGAEAAAPPKKKRGREPDPFGRDFEGADPEPAPPLRRGHVGGAGRARAVPRASAVPGLRRRAAEAGEPRRRVKGRTIADYVDLPIAEALPRVRRAWS